MLTGTLRGALPRASHREISSIQFDFMHRGQRAELKGPQPWRFTLGSKEIDTHADLAAEQNPSEAREWEEEDQRVCARLFHHSQ